MVVGLLLLVMILNPLLSIFSVDVDDIFAEVSKVEQNTNNSLENSIERKKVDIEMGQRAYISEQVAVQLKREVEEELIEQFDVELKEVAISLDEFADPSVEFEVAIKEVRVLITKKDQVPVDYEGIEAVQVVSIDTSKEFERKVESFDDKPLHNHLSERWQIPKDKISLAWEGGEQ